MADIAYRMMPIRQWKDFRARWIAVRDVRDINDSTPWTFGMGWTKRKAARQLYRKEAALRRESWFDHGPV